MTGNELAQAIQVLGLKNAEFARLAKVSPRAVQLWLSGEREIPGPVDALVQLFAAIPEAMRAAEIARLRDEESTMFGGIFLMRFAGRDGQGAGMLMFDRGTISGADEGGAIYDGEYSPTSDLKALKAKLMVAVPPGVQLVTGVPAQPFQYAFEIQCSIPVAGEAQFEVATPYGPVAIYFKRLRDLPKAA